MKRTSGTLFTASMTLAIVGFAQTASATPDLHFANAHCHIDTLTQEHTWGYVSFAVSSHGIQAILSATEVAGASPLFKTFRVTHGTLGGEAHHVLDGTLERGFEALHTSTSLSAVIDYYWYTFTNMGYTATMDSFNRDSSSYSFDKGVGQLKVVFTTLEDDVAVSVTSAPTLVASR